MDKLKQLYDLYVSNGLLTPDAVSFDDFASASDEQRAGLYDIAVSNNLITADKVDRATFYTAWRDKKKDVTESVSVAGSSEPADLNMEMPGAPQFDGPAPEMPDIDAPAPVGEEPRMLTDVEFEEEKRQREEEKKQREEEKKQRERLQKEEDQRYAGITKEFRDQFDVSVAAAEQVPELEDIDYDFVNRKEERVVPDLRNRFGKYGFSFSESRVGANEVKVTAPDGTERTFALKDLVYLPKPQKSGGYGYYDESIDKTSAELRDFIQSKAVAYNMPDLPEPQQMPLTLADESFMAIAKEEGLDPEVALQNVQRFKTLQERVALMERIVEGGEAAAGRILDASPEVAVAYPDIFIAPEGLLAEKLRQERVELRALGRGDLAGVNFEAYQRIDEKLAMERDQQMRERENTIRRRTAQIKDLDRGSQVEFGVPVKELYDYAEQRIAQGTLTQQEAVRINDYLNSYRNAAVDAQTAADTHKVIRMLYSKPMLYEDARYEFTNSMAGLANSWRDGINRGEAGWTLIAIQLGMKDASNEDVLAELTGRFERIINPGPTSRAAEYVNRKRALATGGGVEQFLDSTFSGRGLEFLLQTSAQSLSQMLPPGKRIFPIAMGTGAVIGGASAGPPGAVGGAFTGLAKGAQLASALSGFLVEYNNSIVDAAIESGFDVTDPKQWEQALNTESVWTEARNIGAKRGLTIGLVDYVTAGLAGRVFAVGKTASVGRRAASAVAEQGLIEMPSEALGEFTAQVVAGQDVDMYEVLLEGAAGIAGPQPVNAALNIMADTYRQRNGSLAKSLMTYEGILDIPDSKEAITKFADEQAKTGIISEEDASTIKRKAGFVDQAQALLAEAEADTDAETSRDITVRVAELLEAKKDLERNPDFNRNKIAEIDEELAFISDNGRLPAEQTELPSKQKEAEQKAKDQEKKTDEPAQPEQETQEEEDVIAVDATPEDEQAFDDGELDEQRSAGIAMRIAEKEQAAEALTPFEVRFAADNVSLVERSKDALADVEALERELDGYDARSIPINKITPRTDNDRTQIKRTKLKRSSKNAPALAAPSPEPAPTPAPEPTAEPTTEPTAEQAPEVSAEQAPEVSAEQAPEVSADEQLYQQALEALKAGTRPSNNALRKALGVGYARAKRVLDRLEAEGVVSEADARGRRTLRLEEDEVEERVQQQTRKISGVSINEQRDRTPVRRRPVSRVVKEAFTEPEPLEDSEPLTEPLDQTEEPESEEALGNTIVEAANLDEEETQALQEAAPEETGRRVIHVTRKLSNATPEQRQSYLSKLKPKLASALKKILRSAWTYLGAAMIGLSLYVSADVERAASQAVAITPTPVIEVAINDILPAEQASMLNRLAVKSGKITPVETQMVFEDTVATAPPDSTQPSFFQKIRQTADGLWSYRSQWSADSGFVYIAMPNRRNRPDGGATASARGVAHFLLDGDISVDGVYRHPYNRSLHNTNRERDAFVPVFERLSGNRVRLTYKRYSEVGDGQIVATPMRQYRFGDIDFGNSQRASGFKSAREVVLKDGVSNPYTGGRGTYMIYTGSKDNYGKFSGSSVVFIWEHDGKRYVRDFAGSVNQIQAEGLAIAKDYGIDPKELTLGYHDVGSFSAKPVAQEGQVSTNQYQSYNPNGFTGAALLIPHSQAPTGAEAMMDMTQAFEAASAAFGETMDVESILGMTVDQEKPTTRFKAEDGGPSNMDEMAVSMSDGDISKAQKLITGLNRMLPFVQITMDRGAFNEALAQEGTRQVVKDGAVIYGIAKGGSIFINPDVHNNFDSLSNTLIHEFGHVWVSTLRTTARGMGILDRGFELVRGTEGYQRNLNRYGDPDVAAEEALVELIASKGQSIVNEATRDSATSWLSDLWSFIKSRFRGLRELSQEQIEGLTLNQFVEAAAADILSGEEMSVSAEQQRIITNRLDAMFSAGKLSSADINKIITLGRFNGFSDATIKAVLRKRGVSAEVIKDAMRVSVDLLSVMPPEFGNIKGGALNGLKMFREVREEVDKYASSTEGGAYPSNREVREYAQIALANHSIYQLQDELTQKRLNVAFDTALGNRARGSVAQQIKEIKAELRHRKEAVKDFKSMQADLVGLVKAITPSEVLFGFKSDINRLLKLVSTMNEENAFVRVEELLSTLDSISTRLEERNQSANAKIEKAKEKFGERIDKMRTKLNERQDTINALRQTARDQRVTRNRLRNLVRRQMPKYSGYTRDEVNKIIKAIDKVTPENFVAKADKVLEVLDGVNARIKRGALADLYKFAKNQVKSGTLSADDKLYFAAVAKVLRYASRGDVDGMLSLATALSIERDRTKVAAVMAKHAKGERLDKAEKKIVVQETARQRSLDGEPLDAQQREFITLEEAFETFGGVAEMDAFEVLQLLRDLRDGRKITSNDFKANKIARGLEMIDLKRELKFAADQRLPTLYYRDENGALVLKDKNQLESDYRGTVKEMQESGYTKGVEKLSKKMLGNDPKRDIKSIFRALFSDVVIHLGSLTRLMDGRNGSFFTDNVYRPLNRADERFLDGRRKTRKKLDEIANNITGGTKGMKGIYKLEPKHKIVINTGKEKYNLTAGEAMRVYALSLNPGQNHRLGNMGIGEPRIDQIRAFLGTSIITFVEDVTDFLGGEYYESINNVYSSLENQHLRREENYFPTRSAGVLRQDVDLTGEDFFARFSNQYGPLQERQALETAPQIIGRGDNLGSLDFFDVLLQHVNTMERYKAYAELTQKLNALFSTSDMAALTGEYGLGNSKLLKQLVSHAINGANIGLNVQQERRTAWAMTKLTGYYLGFRLVQIPKQASSFFNAFEKYNFRGADKDNIDKLGVSDGVLDLLGFGADLAVVILKFRKYLKLMREKSASFDDRITQGLSGDMLGLESGNPYSVITPSRGAGFWTKLARAAAFPTIIGDIIGVLGYAINYRRNLINGMSEEQALEEFNDYNTTQQTRRGTERSLIQQQSSWYVRMVTAFASVPFLQFNKVLQAGYGIGADLRQGKVPKKTDIRSLVINGFVANALFSLAGNMFKLALGDDEDRREVWSRLLEAGSLSILYRLPMYGAFIEQFVALSKGDRHKAARIDSAINPYLRITSDIDRSYSKEGLYGAAKTAVDFSLGFKTDPAIGLYEMFGEDTDPEESFYKIIGLSEHYQPEE